jgi:hypothetical protein
MSVGLTRLDTRSPEGPVWSAEGKPDARG